METQSLTLPIPKRLLEKAKQAAAERGISVTALVIEGLTRSVSGDEAYEAAWRRQKALMAFGLVLRGEAEGLPRRETLHERS